MALDAPPVLTIGALLGDADSESLAWVPVISALSSEVDRLVTGMSSPVRLSIEFHVDGRIEPNTFDGVRTGRFSRGRSHLVVQAAVQKVPNESRRGMLLSLLDDAVVEAERFLSAKGAEGVLPELRQLVTLLRT